MAIMALSGASPSSPASPAMKRTAGIRSDAINSRQGAHVLRGHRRVSDSSLDRSPDDVEVGSGLTGQVAGEFLGLVFVTETRAGQDDLKPVRHAVAMLSVKTETDTTAAGAQKFDTSVRNALKLTELDDRALLAMVSLDLHTARAEG